MRNLGSRQIGPVFGFLRGVAAATLGCVLSTASPARAEITLWTIETNVRIETIRYLARAFEAETGLGPVTVTGVDENQIPIRLEAAVRDGDGPDLLLTNIEQLVAAAPYYPLDTRLPSRVIANAGTQAFSPVALRNVATVNPRDTSGRPPATAPYMAVPMYAWVQGLWYRKDWFDRDGLVRPDTWQAIRVAAEHFHDPKAGRYGIVMGTGESVFTEQIFTQLALANGADVTSVAPADLPDNPALQETIAYYKDLAAFTPPGTTDWDAYHNYVNGNAAMVFFSSYFMEMLLTALEEATPGTVDPDLPDKTGLVSAITRTRSARFGALRVMGFSANMSAQDKETARAFVTFLLRQDAYIAFLHTAPGAMLPTLRGVIGNPVFYNDPQNVFRRYKRSNMRALDLHDSFIETFSIRPTGFHPGAARFSGPKLFPAAILEAIEGNDPRTALKKMLDRLPAPSGSPNPRHPG